MELSTAKSELLHHFARIGKAVASPQRLELLDLLAQSEKSVEVLARQAGLSVKNTSAHLKELRSAALVSTRREGAFVFYRLADPAVHDFLRALQELARRRLGDVERLVRDYYEAQDELEPVGAGELLERMRQGEVTVLDVRPEDEYRAGHIPGALPVPLGELERHLAELPRDREVVAYCRGPYCVLAVRALELLHARGFRARRLDGGLPDWETLGYPVARAGDA